MKPAPWWREKLAEAEMKRGLLASLAAVTQRRIEVLVDLTKRPTVERWRRVKYLRSELERRGIPRMNIPAFASRAYLRGRLLRAQTLLANTQKQINQLNTTKIPYYQERIRVLSELTVWDRVKRG